LKKVILITGASSGIGESIAYHLASLGHIVYGTSRNVFVNENIRTLKVDVCIQESVQAAVFQIIKERGHIDILINNAGLDMAGPSEQMSQSDIERLFNVNVFGAVRMINCALPYMRKNNSGLIINISSIAAASGLPYRGFYSASKSALERITESLRLEVSSLGIKACYVQPGCFATNINSNRILPNDLGDSEYNSSWNRVHDVINQTVNDGLNPSQLARLIERIINAKRIKSRYRIGKPIEKLSASMKGLVPGVLFEKILKIYFKA
jgi:NAD(P)-dependent dehydrogenase (short-subunit alcohol dehydrogenase family)